MADITPTPANVQPTASTIIARGTAGVAVNAGHQVYADPASNPVGLIKPAQAAGGTAAQAAVVGMALNNAAVGQPVEYATSGDVTVNAVLGQGKAYVLGGGAGTLAPAEDLNNATANTRYGTQIGVATSTTNLRLGINVSGVLKNP
jgi:hypothetical protein